jgi:hypothetical protein
MLGTLDPRGREGERAVLASAVGPTAPISSGSHVTRNDRLSRPNSTASHQSIAPSLPAAASRPATHVAPPGSSSAPVIVDRHVQDTAHPAGGRHSP